MVSGNGYTNAPMGGGTKLFRLWDHGLGEVDDVLAEARKIEAEDEAFRARIAGEVIAGPSTGARAVRALGEPAG